MGSSMENCHQATLPPAARKIVLARHHDPFEYLGRHTTQRQSRQETVIRVILPTAVSASLIEPPLAFQRVAGTVIFELTTTIDTAIPQHYAVEWISGDGRVQRHHDSYRFPAQITEHELALFLNSKLHRADKILGAHLITVDGVVGVLFATWAPNAERVSVVGHFNQWDGRCHAMRARGASGIWEIFIPELAPGEPYQFELRNHHSGTVQLKPDPYAQQFDTATGHHALVPANSHQWKDQQWMFIRASYDWQHSPISIYEADLTTWKRNHNGSPLSYRTLAKELLGYLYHGGFTHLMLFSESLIATGSGLFAPDSRLGTADDFRYFIDCCHQRRIGVIVSWHIDHQPSGCDNLRHFDGGSLYELESDQNCKQNADNPPRFDFSRNGVRNFLISSVLFWLDAYHIDGLKLRTTTAMLYPDERQDDDVISLLREINDLAYQKYPGVLMLAEENTVWPGVTRPSGLAGLGFSLKWNIGWHHDTLRYFSNTTAARPAQYETLIFSQNYAFSEHFILPLSHPGRGKNETPLLQQMPGKIAQRFANLRLLYSYMFTHPGKKQLFMGSEFAATTQGNSQEGLPWVLAEKMLHKGLSRLVTELNSIYRNTPALHYYDLEEKGFNWIESHDCGQSLTVFQRNSNEDSVIVALNFSDKTNNVYRIGVSYNAIYKEIFNSDAHHFGGEERLNHGGITAENIPWMKQPFSVTITLPALSAVIIKPLINIPENTLMHAPTTGR